MRDVGPHSEPEPGRSGTVRCPCVCSVASPTRSLDRAAARRLLRQRARRAYVPRCGRLDRSPPVSELPVGFPFHLRRVAVPRPPLLPPPRHRPAHRSHQMAQPHLQAIRGRHPGSGAGGRPLPPAGARRSTCGPGESGSGPSRHLRDRVAQVFVCPPSQHRRSPGRESDTISHTAGIHHPGGMWWVTRTGRADVGRPPRHREQPKRHG